MSIYKDLKPYNPGVITCIKCGHLGKPKDHYRLGGSILSSPPTPDTILRRCRNCGYDWLELPLDHEERKEE